MNKTEKDAHFKSQLSQAMVWGGDGVAAKGGALSHQESGRSPGWELGLQSKTKFSAVLDK